MLLETKITIDIERCKGCKLCIDACPNPNEILKMSEIPNNNGHLYAQIVDQESCNGCGLCYKMCPDGCIEILNT